MSTTCYSIYRLLIPQWKTVRVPVNGSTAAEIDAPINFSSGTYVAVGTLGWPSSSSYSHVSLEKYGSLTSAWIRGTISGGFVDLNLILIGY